MVSAKQLAANRRNAQHSPGPVTDSGKRRVSVNAIKHGLTIPVELSALGSHLAEVGKLLESDGYNEIDAMELARSILDFERNVQRARDDLLQLENGRPQPINVGAAGQDELRVANSAIRLAMDEDLALTLLERKYLKGIGQISDRFAKKQIRVAEKEFIDSSDRHFRRSVNQLIKKLKNI